jgi:hypothetical protein
VWSCGGGLAGGARVGCGCPGARAVRLCLTGFTHMCHKFD